jgi:hypothetical protein
MKIRRVVAGGLVGLAMLGLAACGTDVTQGLVTGKKYTPESHYTEWLPVYGTTCTQSGTTTSCHQYIVMWTPTKQTDPECWELDLQDGKHTGSVCVSHKDYDAAKVGSFWGKSK